MIILNNPPRVCREPVVGVRGRDVDYRSRNHARATNAVAGVKSPPPGSANLGHPAHPHSCYAGMAHPPLERGAARMAGLAQLLEEFL